MTCNTETETIGDITYSATQWPAEKAMEMKFQLMGLFGPSLVTIIDQKEGEFDGEVISSVVEKLFASHSPQQMVALMKEVMIDVMVSGGDLPAHKFQSADFNLLFTGDQLINCYKVFFFIVKVNYGNLISGNRLEGVVAKVMNQI